MYTELRPFNVRVTAVIPGAGSTNFSKNAGLPEPASPFALKPEDMAEVILHICRMPQHIEVEEYRFWGTDQEVIPL
jgi:NADP-dependent 3-hydroxy acid dehydrogenase YdfG